MGMSEHVRNLLTELLKVSDEEKQVVAEALLDSIEVKGDDAPLDPDRPIRYEKEWIEEVRRRQALGRPGIPFDQAMAQSREKLRAIAKARPR
jgi:hypothetical protein